MSRLLIVRHGQASLMRADYDQLSELGVEQSRALGRYLVAQKTQPTRVFTGPKKRHHQTLAGVAEAFQEAGLDWPEPTELAGFDEYSAFQLVAGVLPLFQERDPEMARLITGLSGGGTREPEVFLRVFQKVSAAWAAGEVDVEGVGTWQDFRDRVEGAVATLRSATASQETVLAFTSGGPVAATAGFALGLNGARTMELTWVVENASFSEYLLAGDRFSLHSFNRTPHLVQKHLRTRV